MRLIGTFDTESQAYMLSATLMKEGIQNVYEPFTPEGEENERYRLWVYEEEDLFAAMKWVEFFKNHPDDVKFQKVEAHPGGRGFSKEQLASDEPLIVSQVGSGLKPRRILGLVHWVIIICAVLFFWNDLEEVQILKEKGEVARELSLTSVQKTLLFDDPKVYQLLAEFINTYPLKQYQGVNQIPIEAQQVLTQIEQTPSWKGLYPFFLSVRDKGWDTAIKETPLFEKIGQGEIWRFFSPCLLHRDFLHILFNMAWVWILLKQIEVRVKKWRICLLILIIGSVSNVAQYLISGPNFIGFSGVVVGLAGFIWMRQKIAPWEGYPLQKGTVLFLAFFVLSMLALEIITFSLQLFSLVQVTPVIANTAHIVGGMMGLVLGRISLFKRGSL